MDADAAQNTLDGLSVVPEPVSAPTGLSAALVRVTSSLVTAGLDPLLTTNPQAPVLPSPDLLMALAWAGREIGGIGPIVLDPSVLGPIVVGPIVWDPNPNPTPDPTPTRRLNRHRWQSCQYPTSPSTPTRC